MPFTQKQIESLENGLLNPKYLKKKPGSNSSYIEHSVVTREMNSVFGRDGWSMAVLGTWQANMVHFRKTDRSGKEVDWVSVTYGSTVRITVGDVVREDVGACSAQMRASMVGEAIEMAMKGAVSDGLKRCCYKFGNIMGLALYGDMGSEGMLQGDEGEALVPTEEDGEDDRILARIQAASSKRELVAIHRRMSPSEKTRYQATLKQAKARIESEEAE